MKNSAEKSKRAARDQAIGRVLVKAIAHEEDGAICPSAEEMAALVEKRLDGDERQRIMGHIAGCERCLSSFVLTSRQAEAEQKDSIAVNSSQTTALKGGGRSRGWMAALGTIAAVLVVAFLLPWQKAGEVGRESQVSVFSLAQLAGMELSEPMAPSATRRSYGFTAFPSRKAAAFHTGAAAIDLVAACKQNNVSRKSAAIDRLTHLLGPEVSKAAFKAFSGGAFPNLKEINRLLVRLTQHAESKGQLSPFLLGAWVQTGRLSSDELLPKIVHLDALDQWLDASENQELPPPVRRVLTRLRSVLADGEPLSDRDISRVRRLLNELSGLF